MKHWRGNERDIARERMEILLGLAKKTLRKDPKLMRRYIELARRIGMRSQVSIPKEYKQRICKNCGTFLVPGFNCRVRTRPDGGTKVVITCLDCGSHKRYPTLKEKNLR